MALASFSPTNFGMVAAGRTSAAQAVPGGAGATLLVSNLGPYPAAVLLGNSTVAVTAATGVVVLPNQALPLAVGTATHIAAIAVGGNLAQLNLAQGA